MYYYAMWPHIFIKANKHKNAFIVVYFINMENYKLNSLGYQYYWKEKEIVRAREKFYIFILDYLNQNL